MAIVTQSPQSQSSAVINGQSVEYFTQQLQQHCAGLPDSLANSVFMNVVREFYYKSTGWREILGPLTLSQGQNILYLNPVDSYSQVHLVLDLFAYPDFTGGNTPRYLHPAPRQKFGADTGPPTQYYMQVPDEAVLYPVPAQNYGQIMYAYCIMMPVINAAQLPNFSVTHHFDGLFYGSLYRLCSMPNKPWTVKDAAMLRDWRSTYRREIAMARDIANRSWSKTDTPFTFPNFAGRYSQSPQAAAGNTF